MRAGRALRIPLASCACLHRAMYVLITKTPKEGRNGTLNDAQRRELDGMTHAQMLAEMEVSFSPCLRAAGPGRGHRSHSRILSFRR